MTDILIPVFNALLILFILVCFAVTPGGDGDDDGRKDKQSQQGIPLSISKRTYLLRYSLIHSAKYYASLLLLLIDLACALFRDTSSVLDVPLALVAIYLWRLMLGVELLGSIVDTPFFFLGPFLSVRVRMLVWTGIYLFESTVYRVLVKGFVHAPPKWLKETSEWKWDLAWRWWNH